MFKNMPSAPAPSKKAALSLAQLADNIFNFLTNHSYENYVTIKQLQSPSTKTFYQIFNFLMRLYDPNF